MIRDALMWFAQQQEKVLKENDWKDPYQKEGNWYLYGSLLAEIKELFDAMNDPNTEAHEIIKEAVDVGNVAMFIASNTYRKLTSEYKPFGNTHE